MTDGPAAEGIPSGWYPASPVQTNHTAPCPRRIRAVLADQTVLDTTRAIYVWEHRYYPQLYIPADDVRAEFMADDGEAADSPQGRVAVRSVVGPDGARVGGARFVTDSTITGLTDTYRIDWTAMDAWFEEDERVFVHPRSPYSRVDALRSNRHVRVELDGAVLAEADTAVAVFETGLPPRWYVDRSSVRWDVLEASDTRSACPYKGETSAYWNAVTPRGRHTDIAWSYDFPTRHLLPIAGLVCFYDEKVIQTVDGRPTAG